MSVVNKLSTVLMMALLVFTACAKRINKDCRIVASTINPFNDTTRIYYANNGKVKRVVDGISVTEYTYSGRQMTKIRMDTGVFTSKTVVDVNTAGLATNVRVYFDETGNGWANTAYEYNGEEVRKETFTTSVGGREDITTYTWRDHNIVSSTRNGAITIWQYYSQYKRQIGDYLSYLELLNGFAVFKTKDLLWTGDKVSLIHYNFNSNTNISEVSFNMGNTSYRLKYEYECN